MYKNLHEGKVTDALFFRTEKERDSFNRAGNSQNEQQDVNHSIFKDCCTKYISCSFLNAHLCSKRLDLSIGVTAKALQKTNFKVIQSCRSKDLYWAYMPNILSVYHWKRTYFTIA